ncbi:MAG: class I SAM-dependent methyltransferase [Pseudomonadota bacterium]
MSTRSYGLSPEVLNYLKSVSVTADPLWEQLRDETTRVVGFNMQISPEQAQLMTVLLKLVNARQAIEIGTFTGYSALTIARALPNDGRLVACDVSTEWTTIAQRYWRMAGVQEKIDLQIAPALETLDKLLSQGQQGSYDFAFIDADKGGYLAYYERCVQLLRTGGIVCVDNTLWGGAVADPQKNDADTRAIRKVNEAMFEDSRVDNSLIPIGDGLHIAYKR